MEDKLIMKDATKRSIFRWIHIVFAIPIIGYIYSPFEQIPNYAPATRFVFVPVIVLSGLWMWKGHVLRRLISNTPCKFSPPGWRTRDGITTRHTQACARKLITKLPGAFLFFCRKLRSRGYTTRNASGREEWFPVCRPTGSWPDQLIQARFPVLIRTAA
jgi:hypothetical protein